MHRCDNDSAKIENTINNAAKNVPQEVRHTTVQAETRSYRGARGMEARRRDHWFEHLENTYKQTHLHSHTTTMGIIDDGTSDVGCENEW